MLNRTVRISLLAVAIVAAACTPSTDETADLAARIAAAEQRVTRAESVRAIKRLQYAYGHYVEFGLWHDFADLFTEDAIAHYPAGDLGREAIRELFFDQVGGGQLGLAEGRLYPHFVLQPVVTLDPSGETAHGRWHVLTPQPWVKGKNAEMMIPFFATTEDMALYRFMDVRISGLGPYFSGILLLSLVLSVMIMFRQQLPKAILVIGIVTIVITLLISNHTWWARYAPQLWWLPVIPLIVVFYKSDSRLLLRFSLTILILLFINAVIIFGVHLQWEISATRTLSNQLKELKESNATIEVDMQWFGTPVGERFKTWGIPFKIVPQDQLLDGKKLMSVVEGYPGCVMYRPLVDK
jgi:hypothetical protein